MHKNKFDDDLVCKIIDVIVIVFGFCFLDSNIYLKYFNRNAF
jgi:hypothetical protein